MADKKINYDRLMDMMAEKMSQAEIARTMRVNPSTITRAVQRLRAHSKKIVPLEKSDRCAEINFRLWEEFMRGFSSVNRFLDGLEAYIYDGDRKIFSSMERKTESKSVESGMGIEPKKTQNKGGGKKSRIEQKIERFDFGIDPKALLVKVLQIREEHVMDALDLARHIVDSEALISFLNDMVRIMCKMDPGVKHEVEESLKRHQLIRSIVTFGPLDQGDMRN